MHNNESLKSQFIQITKKHFLTYLWRYLGMQKVLVLFAMVLGHLHFFITFPVPLYPQLHTFTVKSSPVRWGLRALLKGTTVMVMDQPVC